MNKIGYLEGFCNEAEHLSLCKGIVATFLKHSIKYTVIISQIFEVKYVYEK